MRKIILGIIVVAALAVTYKNLGGESAMPLISDLSLQNIEALSSGESSTYHCIGYGSVYCPDGDYYEYVFTGYSL